MVERIKKVYFTVILVSLFFFFVSFLPVQAEDFTQFKGTLAWLQETNYQHPNWIAGSVYCGGQCLVPGYKLAACTAVGCNTVWYCDGVGCPSSSAAQSIYGPLTGHWTLNGDVWNAPGGYTVAVADLTVSPPYDIPTLKTRLADAMATGQLYDQSGNPSLVIPSGELPASRSWCANLGGSTNNHCWIQGSTGMVYDTWIDMSKSGGGAPSPVQVAGTYSKLRTEGKAVWDERDKLMIDTLKQNLGSNEVSRVFDSSSSVRKYSNDDFTLNTFQANNDGSAYTLSGDAKNDILASNKASYSTSAKGSGMPSSDPVVANAQGIAREIAQGARGSENTSSGTGSSAVNYYVTNNQVEAVNTTTGQSIGKVFISDGLGGGLSTGQVSDLVSSGNTSGVLGDSKFIQGAYSPVAGSRNGFSSTGTATGLPSGPAAVAGSGTGSNTLGSGGFYSPSYGGPGKGLGDLFNTHYAVWGASGLVQGLNQLKPSFGAHALPSWCFNSTLANGQQYCFNLGDSKFSWVFSVIGSVLVLGASYSAYQIIILRGKA
ncbi:MAG: hypothetical protein HZA02_06435 [Nitrospinae bacterium]|nr:hypothetical protein [Nitrospinota bacterium]